MSSDVLRDVRLRHCRWRMKSSYRN